MRVSPPCVSLVLSRARFRSNLGRIWRGSPLCGVVVPVSEVDPPFPILRAVLAILLSTVTALLLMPVFTYAPRLFGFGGPIGLFFSLVLAPMAGLFLGAVLAPLTVALQSATIFGLVALAPRQPLAMHPLSWGAAGLVVGALARTSIGLEIATLGFELPWTVGSGAVTGIICGLAARAIMTL